MAGTEENAGWLPPLLWNVFTKGCARLWSLDSRPCISNILLFCLSLWVLCERFSPHFLFIFVFCCCSEWKSCSNFYSYSWLFHLLISCYLLLFVPLDNIEWSWIQNMLRMKIKIGNCSTLDFRVIFSFLFFCIWFLIDKERGSVDQQIFLFNKITEKATHSLQG